MRRVVRKVATVEGGLVWFRGGFTAGTLFLDRWTCIWHPKEYWKYHNTIFDKKIFDKLPPQRLWDHAIEIIPGASLKDCKAYPLTTKEQQELNKFLEEHLKSGRIQHSKSLYTVPFVFIKKNDGSLWPVQDYQRLNKVTVKNKYSLPLI